MKIDDSTGKLPQLPPTAGRATVSKTEDSAPARRTDKVSLSAPGKTLGASDAPPIDMAKVEEVRAAIAEGRFHIDAEGIADRVISSNRELVGRG